MSESLTTTDADKHVCQNCQTIFDTDELLKIEDIAERVQPGEIMPSGQCPDQECGAVCHPYEETGELWHDMKCAWLPTDSSPYLTDGVMHILCDFQDEAIWGDLVVAPVLDSPSRDDNEFIGVIVWLRGEPRRWKALLTEVRKKSEGAANLLDRIRNDPRFDYLRISL